MVRADSTGEGWDEDRAHGGQGQEVSFHGDGVWMFVDADVAIEQMWIG